MMLGRPPTPEDYMYPDVQPDGDTEQAAGVEGEESSMVVGDSYRNIAAAVI